MFRKFRTVEAVFNEPQTLNSADIVGKLPLKAGAQLLGPSSVLMEGPGGGGGAKQKYTLTFAVSEDTGDVRTVEHDIALVSDVSEFEYSGVATLLCDLRNTGNCGGLIFLLSPAEHAPRIVPAIETRNVTSRLVTES